MEKEHISNLLQKFHLEDNSSKVFDILQKLIDLRWKPEQRADIIKACVYGNQLGFADEFYFNLGIDEKNQFFSDCLSLSESESFDQFFSEDFAVNYVLSLVLPKKGELACIIEEEDADSIQEMSLLLKHSNVSSLKK